MRMSGTRSQESGSRKSDAEERMIQRVEDLEVFRRAYRLSLDVHQASLGFPRIEQFALADQVRRSSKSICANLAEGFAKQRYSAAEYRRYLTAAIGSDETQLWLRYCVDLGYIEASAGERWIVDYVEISKMLRGLHASWSRSS
jgi:four helix bundle protein